MAQQLNLFEARFAPTALRFSARHGVAVIAAVLLLSALAAQGLNWAGRRANAEAQATQAATAPLRAELLALAKGRTAATRSPGGEPLNDPGLEVAQLQALAAGQRRIRAALDTGVAGTREGHADYLAALARRSSDALWITAFSVSDDGRAIDLEGRMTDADVLTHYLRALNGEPRFRGRPFAQLTLKAVNGGGAAPAFIEFSLRSAVANGAKP